MRRSFSISPAFARTLSARNGHVGSLAASCGLRLDQVSRYKAGFGFGAETAVRLRRLAELIGMPGDEAIVEESR